MKFSRQYFEKIYELSGKDDPYGASWRGSQKYRLDLCDSLLDECVFSRSQGDLRILDIGCATGDFTARLRRSSTYVVGIDISQVAIQRAKERFQFVDFRIASLPNTEFPQASCDLITCLESIYYLDEINQQRALHEIRSLLTDDGRVLFSSYIGCKPCFLPDEFAELISEYFDIERVEYYHAWLYQRMEKVFRRLYDEMHLFLLSDTDFEDLNRDRRLYKIVKIARSNQTRFITKPLAQVIMRSVRIILGLKTPVQRCNILSRKLSVGRSHTFILARPRTT